MGQRSQVIIFWEREKYQGVQLERVARHLQWNYGHFMIQRAHNAITAWHTMTENRDAMFINDEHIAGLLAMFCYNPNTGDVQGLHPTDDESVHRLDEMDNNNGAFLIHIDKDAHATFAFIIGDEDGGDLRTVVTASEYMAAATRRMTDTDRECLELVADKVAELDAMGAYMSQEVANMVMDTIADGKKVAVVGAA